MNKLSDWMTEKYAHCVDEDIWQVIAYGVFYLLPMRTQVYGVGRINEIDLDLYLRQELIFLGLFGMLDLDDYYQSKFSTLRELDLPDEVIKSLEDQKYFLSRFFQRQFPNKKWDDFVRDFCYNHDLVYGEIIEDEEGKAIEFCKECIRCEMNERPNYFVKKTKELFDEYAAEGKMITLEQYIDFTLEYMPEYLDYVEEEAEVIYGEDGLPVVLEPNEFKEISSYYSNLRKQLSLKVIGQDPAVKKFVQGLFAAKLNNRETQCGPEASFLFVGPPGVGKTFLAQNAAKLLGREYKIFQMNEYAQSQSYENLIGFASTYRNSKNGELTSYVKDNPNAVLIFDEIEKAHINTLHLFLSILEGGFLVDLYNAEEVDFRNNILIFTTNAGRDFYEEKKDMLISSIPEATIIDAIKKDKKANNEPVMPTEILSRLTKGVIIGFDHMNPPKLIPIIKKSMKEAKEVIESTLDLECEFDESMLPYLFLYHLGSQLDARVAASRSANFMKDCVYTLSERIGVDGENYADNLRRICFEVQKEPLTDEYINCTDIKKVLLVSYRRDRRKFEPTEEDRFVRFDAWNMMDENGDQVKVKEIMQEHEIDLILIDPFMAGVQMEDTPGEYEGVLYRNTHGNKVLHWILAQENMPPVYALELNGHINPVDRMELQKNGVQGILNLVGKSAEECREELNNLIYEMFLSDKINTLVSKGRCMNFEVGLRVEEDTVHLKLHNFKLTNNMSADAADVIVSDKDKPEFLFSDIIGAENAKEELRNFIKFIKNPKEYKKEGLQISKGILLYGPPGTGKTALAKALAAEADCPFIATTGAQFVNGSKKIEDIFRLARKYAPSVVFIDEIDSFALDRRTTDGNRATILNNLLTEMDGFEGKANKPVFVIAATNAAEAPGIGGNNIRLDSALQRRFSKKVYVDLPNREERMEYLLLNQKKNAKKNYSLRLLTEDELNEVARLTAGHSIAEIQNAISLAINRAAENETDVTKDLLVEVFEEMVYGEKLNIAEKHLMTTALHEAGHALLSFEAGERFYPEYATLVARGNYLGMVKCIDDETHQTFSKEDYLRRIRVSLAGRAAEIVFNGEEEGLTTGASNDLEQATYLAKAIISSYGMMEGHLPVISPDVMMQSALASMYYEKLNSILMEQLTLTIEVIKEHREALVKLAEAMIEKSRLETAEMYYILYGEELKTEEDAPEE